MHNGQTDHPTAALHGATLSARHDQFAAQDLADAVGDLFVAFDRSGRCCAWNRVSAETLGIPAGRALGRRFQEVFPNLDASALAARGRRCVTQGAVESFDYTTQSLKEPRILSVRMVPHRGELLVIARDVTAERCASAALEALAAEREALLRERSHRLKNDLQLVNSMLHRALRHIESPEVARVLAETQSRVRAMAHVHELLALGPSVDVVDAGTWVGAIARAVCDAHPASRRPLLSVAAVPITLSATAAGRLGCLVSELVSNALRHAWPGRAPGTLQVSLHHHESGAVLVVEDDGVGLPDAPAERRPGRLGLCLAVQFARQLGGRLELSSPRGTRAQVVIPRSQCR